MKNRKLKNYLKLGILLFGVSFLLENCENSNEENINLDFENSENLNLKTVSFQDAINFFNVKIEEVKEERKLLSRRGGEPSLELTPNWNSIDHDELYGIDQAELTLADVEVNRNGDYTSKLFFINRNDKMESIIFTIYQEEVDNDGRIIQATMYFNELNGQFIDGYKIEEGKITKRLVVKKRTNVQKAALFMFFQSKEEDDSWCAGGGGQLDTVYITGSSSSSSGGYGYGPGPTSHGIGGIFSISTYYMGNPTSSGMNYSGGGGGGTRTSITSVAGSLYTHASNEKELASEDDKCPEGYIKNGTKCVCAEGYVKDGNDRCVKKPCTGDPVSNPEIAPQKNSGMAGGMHDTCARKNKKSTCKGIKGRKWHNGVDLKNPLGAPIYAIYDGVATKHTQRNDDGELDGAGYYVAIVSNVNGKTVRLVFFHLQENTRVTGDIKAGDIIGYQGDSGNLKNGIDQGYAISHVHIKAQENGANVDPLNHFKTKINPITGQVTNPCN